MITLSDRVGPCCHNISSSFLFLLVNLFGAYNDFFALPVEPARYFNFEVFNLRRTRYLNMAVMQRQAHAYYKYY